VYSNIIQVWSLSKKSCIVAFEVFLILIPYQDHQSMDA